MKRQTEGDFTAVDLLNYYWIYHRLIVYVAMATVLQFVLIVGFQVAL